MPVYHFEEIKVSAQRRVACPGCGKKRTVRRTFSQTINPYHPAIPKGVSLNSREARIAVGDSVQAKADEWVPSDNESRHGACQQ